MQVNEILLAPQPSTLKASQVICFCFSFLLNDVYFSSLRPYLFLGFNLCFFPRGGGMERCVMGACTCPKHKVKKRAQKEAWILLSFPLNKAVLSNIYEKWHILYVKLQMMCSCWCCICFIYLFYFFYPHKLQGFL